MSPNSIGLEQWKFLVVRDEKLRQSIRAIAWDWTGRVLHGIVNYNGKNFFNHARQ